MSTLTKVFVVLLVVFSIAFTVMTISIVAQTTDWKDTAEKYEQHARVADTNLRNLIASSAAELATARDTVKAHLERIGALEAQLQAAGNKLAQLRAQLARVDSEKSSAEAMSRGLFAQLQVADSARAEYQKQGDELERGSIELQRRNIDLSDRVNELTARVSVLLEEKRHYEQQINILEAENEKLSWVARRPSAGLAFEEPAGAAMTGVEALTPVAQSAIRGHVLDVSDNLVTVSVGNADGVKKGMILVIHRNDEYVGDLEISLVDPNQSAGRLVRSVLTPGSGDQVTNALGLGGSRG